MSGRPVRGSYVPAPTNPATLEAILFLSALTITAWSLATMLMRTVGAW